jgi:hypothetical protein
MLSSVMNKGILKNPQGAHLNVGNFRKYEDVLRDVVLMYPSNTIIAPIGLRTTTFAARLRDAANAVLTFNYPAKFDIEKLREIWPHVAVHAMGDKVVIGTKMGMEDVRAVLRKPANFDTKSRFLTDREDPTIEQLEAAEALVEVTHNVPARFTGKIPEFTPKNPKVVWAPTATPGEWLMTLWD